MPHNGAHRRRAEIIGLLAHTSPADLVTKGKARDLALEIHLLAAEVGALPDEALGKWQSVADLVHLHTLFCRHLLSAYNARTTDEAARILHRLADAMDAAGKEADAA